MKVAIVCDWLLGVGGAERVVLELHHMFPDAPIYTSQYNPHKIDWFKDAEVRTTWLQRLPKFLKKFLPPLRALAFSRLDLRSYDLVISNTGAEAKGVRIGSQTRHICIVNAPTHYYWSRYEQYLKDPGFPTGFNWLARLGLRLLVSPLRAWDFRATQKPTELIAISHHIQKEIKKYYKRDSVVVYPPVNIERFSTPTEKHGNPNERRGFVITGRQTPYKRIDLAVAACSHLSVPLIVIGNGPDHKRLKKMAGKTITFLTNVNDRELPHYLQSAEAFLFPGVDDFGIAPVEALAAGTPVIAYKAGGALDYVVPGKTGEFFDKQSVESLVGALQAFNPNKYDAAKIQTYVQGFSTKQFNQKIKELLHG